MRSRFLLAAIVLLAVASHVQARADNGQAFVSRLLQAIRTHNRTAAAAMFRYPLRVNQPMLPLPIPLENAAAAVRLYDIIFTPDMRCILERARPPQAGQPPPKYPLLTAEGVVTVAGGVLVAQRVGDTFKITRLTIVGTPTRKKSGVPAHSVAADLNLNGVRQFAGVLEGEEFDRYTIRMTKGALLQGRLERFRGLDAMFRVTDLKGHSLNAQADGRRVWAGVMPESGSYRIEIVRHAPFCDPPTSYLLTLSAK